MFPTLGELQDDVAELSQVVRRGSRGRALWIEPLSFPDVIRQAINEVRELNEEIQAWVEATVRRLAQECEG